MSKTVPKGKELKYRLETNDRLDEILRDYEELNDG